MGYKQAVLADNTIVSYLNQIVDFSTGLYPGNAESGPVDATVGADFHIITNSHDAQLRPLHMDAGGISGVAESIGADNGRRD